METMKKKKYALLGLLLALVSCGGGGGGGGGSTSTATPTVPTVTTPSTNNNYDSNGNIMWRSTDRSYNLSNPHNTTSASAALTGSGVKVGVIDVGFNVIGTPYSGVTASAVNARKKDIDEKFGTRFINSSPTPNNPSGDMHGIAVAEMIGGSTSNGLAKNVQIYVRDATVQGTDDFQLDVTKEMYYHLRNNGVTIYNQSFGGDPLTDYSSISSLSNYYVRAIGSDILDFYKSEVNNGKLFIWAAGNETSDIQPSIEAGLPYFEPSLQKGWINVVGLSTKKEENLGDISWNNLDRLSPAGWAKNWTVSAIADYKFTMTDDDDNTKKNTWNMSGSSFATPVVTGAAVLIKQKYPWMDGSLIRQTILSTADDIGAAGVDDNFGWGLLNVGKAINGPSQFLRVLALDDYVVADVPSGTYTFSNNISGDAGIRKTGSGTLNLTGKNTFTGGTVIGSGYLNVYSDYASPVKIESEGTLGTLGNAVLESDISNDGTYINSSETVVKGNYNASSLSRYVSDLGAFLEVKGEADLNGSTLELTSLRGENPEYITTKGVKSEVLTADKGIKGSFSEVETAELLEGSFGKEGDTVSATLSRKDVKEYVSSLSLADDTRIDVAENVETAFRTLDEKIEKGELADVEKFSLKAAQLQMMSLRHSNSKAVLDSLSGHIYGSAQALTFQHSQTVNKDLSNRLVMLGTLENVGDNGGLWVTGIGAKGKLKQDGFGSGKTDVFGGQVGIDKKIGDFIVGTALSYSTSKATFDRYGGESKGDGFGISLYGRYDNDVVPVYIQGRLGMGFISSKVERDILLETGGSQRANINHDDKVFSSYLETGYDSNVGGVVLTPYVGISHDTVRRGNFSEENSQFGLTAPKATFNQTSGHVGIRLGKSVEWSGGSRSTFQGYVSHQVSFNKEDLGFEATYTGLPGASFRVKGIGLSRHQTWVGLGVLTEVTPNFGWYVNYDGKFSQKGNNNIFTTGIRINF